DAGPTRALARARVGARALAAHGQPPAMPVAAVAAEIHQPLDRHRHLATQVALDREAPDLVAQPLELGVVQVLDLLVERNVRRLADLARARPADAVDRGQTDLRVLAIGNVDAGNACHRSSSLSPDAACAAGRCRSRARLR